MWVGRLSAIAQAREQPAWPEAQRERGLTFALRPASEWGRLVGRARMPMRRDKFGVAGVWG